MSTRCTIGVKDNDDEFFIYRHCDGYPDGEHGVLAALKYVANSSLVWPLPRFEAMDFAAGIIACWKERGGNIYCTRSHDAHGDTEHTYDVFQYGSRLKVKHTDLHTQKEEVHVLWKPK